MTANANAISTNGSFTAANCPVDPVLFGGRQQRYSVSPPLAYLPTISRHSSTLTNEELNDIKSEYEDVILNDCEDDADVIDPSSPITTTATNAGSAGVCCSVTADASETLCSSIVGLSTTSTSNTSRNDSVRNVRHFSHLNRINLKEINRNSDGLLSMYQRNLLSYATGKVSCFPERFRQPGQYLQQSALLLLTNGWTSADRYCRCCIPNRTNPGGACRLHRFCPYCSWRAGQQAALTFVPAFDHGTWHSVTGSFTGDVVIRSMADMHSWTIYWDAYRHGFDWMVRDALVRGVYLTEELAVTSMLPAITLPHVHAVVEADTWTEEHSATLADLVGYYLDAQDVQHVVPNVLAKAINSEQSLYYRVGYLFKPLDLVRAYRQSWSEQVAQDDCCQLATNNDLAVQLNSRATDLVLGYAHITTDRPKMHGLGNLNYRRRKQFIGVNRRDHEQHREHLRQLGQQKPDYETDEPTQKPNV